MVGVRTSLSDVEGCSWKLGVTKGKNKGLQKVAGRRKKKV